MSTATRISTKAPNIGNAIVVLVRGSPESLGTASRCRDGTRGTGRRNRSEPGMMTAWSSDRKKSVVVIALAVLLVFAIAAVISYLFKPKD